MYMHVGIYVRIVSIQCFCQIKDGGVHQWYMMFGQLCSTTCTCSIVKQCISTLTLKLKDGKAILSSGGVWGVTWKNNKYIYTL